jgi:tRNA threonylcarbamoyladenosine biosynthesis protein TsaB
VTNPLLLALDTSTATASVALYDGQRVLSETSWLAGREHSTRLLVEVKVALERVGKTAADLSGLVVACGPGSFTGVRVALSVAKGIAAARGLPLWGINSLDVTSAPAALTRLPVRAVLEAGRGRYATALYRDGQSVEPARLASLDQLASTLLEPTLVIGELSVEARTQLERETHARVASIATSVRRGGFLAELGWRRAQTGDPGDPQVVDAIYVS